MAVVHALIVAVLLLQRPVNCQLRFPDGFLFGAATSAYQVEGAWNADGKTPSIWDDLMHQRPELFAGNETSDVAADSYHEFEQDIAALRETGFDFYRFSISWSRVLPDARRPNEAGLAYYDHLIDRLLAEGIRPMVTMYHFDLPAQLNAIGGWTNPEIRKHFVVYARLLFRRFGARVHWWITVNEPFDYCVDGYGSTASWAPMVHGAVLGAEYLCVDNVLKSHALVYRLYRRHFYSAFGGKVGISLSSKFFYDADANMDHSVGSDDLTKLVNDPTSPAVDRALQFKLGWLAHPLFSRAGYYPAVLVETINSNSVRHRLAWSRLPQWSPMWRDLVRGSADFLGLNHYTSRMVRLAEKDAYDNATEPSMDGDQAVRMSVRPEWPRGASSWQYAVPQGMGDILRWIRDEYDNPEVIITENGWSDRGVLRDHGRVRYMHDYLTEVLQAVVVDGCNVTAYTAWSLIDNFEWRQGFTERFGLYGVDLRSANKERRRKLSASYMRSLIQSRTVPEPS